MRHALSLALISLLALAAMLMAGCERDGTGPLEGRSSPGWRAMTLDSLTALANRVDRSLVATSQATATVLPLRDRFTSRRVQAGVSALAAQVAADAHADNDDPNDLISFEFEVARVPTVPSDDVAVVPGGRVGGDQRPRLRPPRSATA
jgi:hypothetical protein